MTMRKKIENCLKQAVENREAAGIGVLVKQNGEELCCVLAGYADLPAKQRVDHVYRVSTVQLDENFRIRRLFSAGGKQYVNVIVSYPDVDAAGQCAAQVFAEDEEAIRKGGGMDTVTFCNRLGEQPLAFAPGTGWRYSTCADVLGAVIEVASGKRFGQFLQEELFDPLGMKDTGFWVPGEKKERLVTCYRKTEAGLKPFSELHLAVGQYDRPPAFESGGAGLVSTLDDYAAFGEMLLNGGEYRGRRILSRAAVDYMTAPQLRENVRQQMWDSLGGYNYSCLMRICDQPGACHQFSEAGEYGWDGWLGTYFINLPKEKITFLLYQNTTDTGTASVTRKCRNILAGQTSVPGR